MPEQNLQSQKSLKELHVQVSSPEATLFDGEAKAISSFNERGPFDVLGGHESFISIIKDSLIVYDLQGQAKMVEVEHGVLRVVGNRVDVFVGF